MMTRFKSNDVFKSRDTKLSRSKCHRKAVIAVARKLAVIMHAMWRDGTFNEGDPTATKEDAARWIAAKEKRVARADL